MTSAKESTPQDRLQAMSETRQKLAAIESEWKSLRQQSRAITISLITEDGFSVAKASMLSGHHRSTITAWLDVWNAENKVSKKKDQ